MKLLIFAALFAFLATDSVKSSKCMSSYDCEVEECCVKSKILGFIKKGDCKPLAKEDESCSVQDTDSGIFRRMYSGHCPCASGLSCETTQEKKLPFGVIINFDERCVPDTVKSTPVEVTTDTVFETKETEIVTEEEITIVPTEDENLDETKETEVVTEEEITTAPTEEEDIDETKETEVVTEEEITIAPTEEEDLDETKETEVVTAEEITNAPTEEEDVNETKETEVVTEEEITNAPTEEEDLDETASPEDDDDDEDIVITFVPEEFTTNVDLETEEIEIATKQENTEAPTEEEELDLTASPEDDDEYKEDE